MENELNMNLSLSGKSGSVICIISFLLLIFCGACGKKTNKQLAQTYYKLCMVELGEGLLSDVAARKALDYVEKALDLDPKPEYQAVQATVLFKLKHYDQSIQCFKRALAGITCPRMRGEILNNMACIYGQQGNSKKACKVWVRLLKSPHYLTPEVAMVNMAKMFVEKGKYEQAKKYCAKAVTRAPMYTDAHFYLALLSYYTQDFALAKKEVTTTLFMEPKHPGAKYLERMLAAS
jgi:Tfp pilus assembly protein PilF